MKEEAEEAIQFNDISMFSFWELYKNKRKNNGHGKNK